MHATPPANVSFTAAFGRTWTTSAIRSSGGGSGGPLCIQYQGSYYPAAVYLGGSAQTVVRALDSGAIDLFNRAEVSGNGGSNNTGGGITHTAVSGTFNTAQPGAVKVLFEPSAAVTAGGGWRLSPETTYRANNTQRSSLTAGSYILQMKTVAGYDTPAVQNVIVTGGQLTTVTYTYAAPLSALETWRQTNFGTTANTGSAANNADPEKDGLENLVEFAFGLNPNQPNAALLPQWQRVGSNWVLTFTQAGSISGITYVAEQSTSLAAASWTPVADTGTAPQHIFTVPVGSAVRKFLRLRVTVP